VRFYDLRYAYPEQSRRPLSATVELDNKLNVVREYFGVRRAPRDHETER
jgi:hypothetical protein